MKIYFQDQKGCYNACVFLSSMEDPSNRIYQLCKFLSFWKGVDKENKSEGWIMFEFLPSDKINFRDLLELYIDKENFVDWNEFLVYCAEKL